jgi:hypothetical protein
VSFGNTAPGRGYNLIGTGQRAEVHYCLADWFAELVVRTPDEPEPIVVLDDRLLLHQTGRERWLLPSGRTVDVAVTDQHFEPWDGEPVAHSYGHKALCSLQGQPAFAELVIVREFRNAGWDAVWIDSRRGRFWRAMPTVSEPVTLPERQSQLLSELAATTGT